MSDMTSEFPIIIMFVIDFTPDILYVVYKLITIMYNISISGATFALLLIVHAFVSNSLRLTPLIH
jgi:hypothetical protein